MYKLKTFLGMLCLTAVVFNADAQEKTKGPGLLEGPATAQLGKIAQVKVPAGFTFLNGDQTRTMLQRAGEPTSGNEVGFMSSEQAGWAVYFDFNEIGYVKDADKEKLDANKLLKQLKEGNDAGNKERRRNGVPELELLGWEKEPTYNPQTHNLEWCLRLRAEGHMLLNYNTRLLGRKGVMEVVLVVDPDKLQATLPAFDEVVASHTFDNGQTYAEYRPGDKIAKYGLGALIVGGAAVGAAKLGLFTSLLVLLKKAWKLVIIAAAAVATFFKKLFNKITGRGDTSVS
jgi:uncharacterized membrane-anchored protein